jgi:hypothetical protein
MEQSQQRIAICHECPNFIRMTTNCTVCGCFMIIKVKIEKASCPMGKW